MRSREAGAIKGDTFCKRQLNSPGHNACGQDYALNTEAASLRGQTLGCCTWSPVLTHVLHHLLSSQQAVHSSGEEHRTLGAEIPWV